MRKIRRGLDLPISGAPEQVIHDGPALKTVAVLGPDYHGMKPTMAVAEGDSVKLGQLLFTDKKTEGVRYTAPAAGRVVAINRGARRVLQSVVIEIDGDEAEQFASYDAGQLAELTREQVVQNLVESGLWTALRTRPYSKVPALDAEPAAIFINAMDTNPLAADPQVVIAGQRDAFQQGVEILSKLAEVTYVCSAPDADLPLPSASNVRHETFAGPHPAGLSGTHIHFLSPVRAGRSVFTINCQDVIAVGKLFTTGVLFTERVVALGGPRVKNPRLLRTRLGANLSELTAGELEEGENRVISGSVFGGSTAVGPLAYLGRYHNQVSVLEEGRERPFLHYLHAGSNRFSILPIYLSRLFKNRKFNFTTSTNGSERALMPIGTYERVVPLDLMPTQLLRALIVGDTQTAQQLGALELDEEDLALCTFVCPGKYEFGPILRDNLTRIEKEG
ncbi:Na(+)-translocating NADH-quinone reductase subunit A [Microbulbifer thermotolerans]|uniref:Na(+)-translocating NADH-quinone reductase subunit A n=1 Tax=Microbulbifer thermotolerans TaxID=252514 RepID=A0A143HLN5_MICTH|nr:Na(+)-translocating NADH-quinone reductase subunit A [Microbulbifer thermotolerans]AMX02634.1 NADH:ubiquinone reductase (Na(+)-transporting) subunit A [Microbulbifer thermotolerans]